MGRPNTALTISPLERSQLRSIVRSRSLPHSLVRRAQIVLLSAAGAANREVARRCGVSAPVVSLWRQRYQQRGIAGLHAELRAGRPRSHSDEQVAALLRKVLHSKPAAATHWSVRSVAAHTGISKSTVARYFALFGLQPHRSKSFKLSTDPFLVEKVRDIVGLYLHPPDHALVLCVDEKSQVQALERTQPVLPMGLGYVEGVLTITIATALPHCSRHWTLSPAGSSPSASRAIATRNS
jgi:transposase